MKPTSNHNNSSYVEFLNTVASRADSLAEGTKFLENAAPFLKAETQQIQELRDDERRGYLMQEIMRLHEQLGIASSNQRILKAMTTPQLDAYAEELYQQLKNRPFKHLSAA
ncbi:hypothetical protein [Floridanema aerugineum]|uniref:Uncharacterized protein n=1 Tax=Floridaenema aerugineum BLCC-F46 TaxID=3153654 RepID=A0ABV4X9N9_9CYAN